MDSSSQGEYTIASCANEIKLWHVPTSQEIKSFAPHKSGSTINCVRWNHNNQVLVSCADDGDVILSHQTGRCLGHLPTGTATSSLPPAVNTLAFSSGSRYLCSGGASEVVDVWDLKKKEKTRTFAGHNGSITALVFGKSDARVASASDSGSIIVHSVVTGTAVCNIGNQQGFAVRDVKYSPHRSALLASSGDDKCVSLWDTNTSTLIKDFPRVHHESVRKVGFSPVSNSLLASVSLDKRIVFYDLNHKRTVKQMLTDYSLTCFDFHSDGVTLAVGSDKGHILSYDLRKSDQPCSKLTNAHSSAVMCLHFMRPLSKGRRQSVDGAAAAPAPQASSSLFTPVKSASSSDPISSSSASSSSSAAAAAAAGFTPHASLPGSDLPLPPPVTGRESLPMSFSTPIPRRSSVGPDPASAGSTHTATLTPVTPAAGTPATAPYTAYTAEGQRATGGPHSSFASATPADPASSSANTPRSFTTPSTSTPGEAFNVRLATATMSAGGAARREGHRVHQEDGAAAAAVINISADMIRGVVRDEVGSVRAGFKEDINNLHLELIRQFHLQQLELRGMLESFSDKYEGLVDEVKTLRKEYEQLRHTY
mmetsp:Transcript_1045/g.1990  ORF Transcript_1045/g.1990 Transcript_1045/m.1990 type:complete len:594 (+) Transcript_1045:74-1855(+)|eukprot:CAMPEP_0175142962 /NCGR_PEP_ID=MMETSP0087-20121206/13132_1 /TAXON_ID=136419 /ORGANISM="Unknown Unknown, Strain D1" /LENGTH=593 /DNA_ID=CAMNT_0016426907 /DNA_START=74 /DNA_END=1855 /DNA_ORIENTATION=+